MRKEKKLFSLILALLVTIVIIAGCAQTVPAEPKEAAEAADDSTKLGGEYKVTIGNGPYPMYQLFYVAKEMGIDELFGLDFELKTFTNSAPGYLATVRGDVDLTYGCIAEMVSVMKGVPEIRHFAPVGFFKGFFFVGRVGEMTPWDELVKEKGFEQAREIRRNEFKGKTIMIIPQKIPLVVDMLEQVGLTEDDVTFMNFADDQKGATAFMAGEGDLYIGGIPQQRKLVEQSDKYINVGGHEILGPAGVWYDTVASTDKFMIDNREAALRTLACMLLTEKFFYKDMQKFAELGAEEMSRLLGSTFSIDDFIEMQTEYDQYQTLELCISDVYNVDSVYYWRNPVEYTFAAAVKEGTLDETYAVDIYFGESEKLFFELLEREDLMKIIEENYN